ncbi:uncharacterized protein OCT59_004088 [Rhizophagus irregularis]|uniref:uncharacterized protein n=1 Tax=Rhizophagus irregularis TaxID=588596 RepID=UPI0033319A83|nr:hypothetical protein OCT59_004088 [Rhizophagus irregularis]
MNLSLRHQHPSTIKIVVCNKNIRCSFGHFTINIRRENLSKKPSSVCYWRSDLIFVTYLSASVYLCADFQHSTTKNRIYHRQ